MNLLLDDRGFPAAIFPPGGSPQKERACRRFVYIAVASVCGCVCKDRFCWGAVLAYGLPWMFVYIAVASVCSYVWRDRL